MLKEIELQNYKSYLAANIPLKRMTILCGANSSGKTAIIKSVLMLKQSIEAAGDNYLLLNSNYTNNGTFSTLVHQTKSESENTCMSLSVTFSIGRNNSGFKDLCRSIGMLKKSEVFSSFDICVTFEFTQDNEFPQVAVIKSSRIEFISQYASTKSNNNKKVVSSIINMENYGDSNQRYDIKLDNFPTPLFGRNDQYPFEYINHEWEDCFCYFRGMQLVSLYKNNLSKTATSALPVLYTIFRVLAAEFNKIEYLGPLREMPLRQYFAQDIYSNIGVRGENTAQYLAQSGDKMFDSPIPQNGGIQQLCLKDAVTIWAKELGVGNVYAISTDIPGAKVTQLKVGDQNIADVGFGVSQVLPVLVEGLAMSKGSTLILEQPEIHLHPKMQMEMADFLIAIAKQGKNLIIETHSDHIINRIVRRAVEDEAVRKWLGIYFVSKNEDNCSKITEVFVDESIGIDEAPEGFFDQYAAESELILHAGYKNIVKKRDGQ